MSHHHADQTSVDEPETFLGTHCLSTEELLGFVQGTLGADQQVRVEDHIDRCSLCAAELDAHYEAFSESVPEMAAVAALPTSVVSPPSRPAEVQWLRASPSESRLDIAAATDAERQQRSTDVLLEVHFAPAMWLRVRLGTGVYVIEVDASMPGAGARIVTVRCRSFGWTFGLTGNPPTGHVNVPIEDGPTSEQVADPASWSLHVSGE